MGHVLICLPKKGPNSSHWVKMGFLSIGYLPIFISQTAEEDAICCFRETGSNKDEPRSGWPPCSTPARDKFIVLTACRNSFRTSLLLKGQWQHALGSVASTPTARTAQARYPSALECKLLPIPCVASITKCLSASVCYVKCMVILSYTHLWYHTNELRSTFQ